jgi:glycosyltransferase involved in cell wall biosynthesis
MSSPSLIVTEPLEVAESTGWRGPAAGVAVVVSSHGRGALLEGLLDALEAQRDVDAEIVVADNGSDDATWSSLIERCGRTPLRLLALRLPFHDGPAVPRNTCIDASRAPLLAFTDDDCLPTPDWLAALVAAFDDGISLVQGRTIPEPGGWAGPWGRSLDVSGPSGLYETANLGARRSAVIAAGGFGAERLLTGRAFGEDVVLGAAIARHGGFRFAADAVVHHRVMPGTYRDFLAERRRLIGFPQLLRQVPELRQRAFGRAFLSPRTAVTDLALAGFATNVIASAVTYSAWPALAWLAVLPWVATLFREAGPRPGRNRAVRAAQLAYADLVGFVALVTGSARARRLLL